MFCLVNLHIRCALHPEMNNQSERPEQKTAPPRRVFEFLHLSFVSSTIIDSVYTDKLIYLSCIYIQYFFFETRLPEHHRCSLWVNKVISINRYLCL